MKLEELETPAVIVDLDTMESNLRTVAGYVKQHGLGLRPHTKTHKIPEIARMQIESGCRGLTVAKVGEAEVMTSAGLDDILVAYPIFGAAKLARLAEMARGKKITVAVDSVITAEAISQAAKQAGSTINLLVEFDAGLRRVGVGSGEQVVELARAIEKLPNVRFAGVTFYPGHVWAPPAEQATGLKSVGEKLSSVLEALRGAGIEYEIVSGGSTPTALNSHLVPGLTEIRPGTYVFNDRNTIGLGACDISECALRVLVTVVSNAVPKRAIIDGGSKTFSGDRWMSGDKTGFGLIVEHPDIVFETMSEEHGHLDLSGSESRPEIGERLQVIPNHVCACVNMHDRIWYHRGGEVEGYWCVAGRGKVV
jgi:D-serine deaminase-like pyridoxal phosphate-dependent protein